MMKPKLSNIVKTDILTMVCILAPVFIMILALDYQFIGLMAEVFSRNHKAASEPSIYFFIFAVILFLALVPYGLYRIYCFHAWFRKAQVVKGMVIQAPYNQERGIFKYRYTFNNREYTAWNWVHRTHETMRIGIGQQVQLAVNIDNPGKAFIKQLYV